MSKILIDEGTLKLVLEALQEVYFGSRSAKHDEAITALREALAEQPAQEEPVAYIRVSKTGNVMACAKTGDFYSLSDGTLLYTSLQPAQQEPVAWVCYGAPGKRDIDFYEADINDLPIGTQLYTSPPAQRTWVGLTDEEIEQGCKESWVTEQAWQSAVWWAEAKLRSKNEDRN